MLWEHEPQASVSTAFSTDRNLSHDLYSCLYTTELQRELGHNLHDQMQ